MTTANSNDRIAFASSPMILASALADVPAGTEVGCEARSDCESRSGCESRSACASSVASDGVARERTLLDDIESLSTCLGEKFEEMRLIHDMTAHLELDDEPSETCEELLEQLAVCVRCETIVIQLDPNQEDAFSGGVQGIGKAIEVRVLNEIVAAALAHRIDGDARNPGRETTELDPDFGNGQSVPRSWRRMPGKGAADKGSSVKSERVSADRRVIVINESEDEALLGRRVVVLPIVRGSVLLGRLIACRSQDDPEFGTVEVDLMRSVLMVLALHLMSQRQYAEMQSMLEGTVRSLASALDAKDAYTHGHSSRVADLAVQLALRLGLNQRTAESLQLAGILHDIGKIGIDDSVLKKPGRLTEEEFDQIKRHPVLGYEILKDIRPFRHILPAVRHHHESWDGSGYPDGLVGEDIPRDAQILAVADAFDAMVSDRPYRRGMPIDKVREIFSEGRGRQWATDVVDVLLASDDLMQAYAEEQLASRHLAACE